jgi:hypothetical protein
MLKFIDICVENVIVLDTTLMQEMFHLFPFQFSDL